MTKLAGNMLGDDVMGSRLGHEINRKIGGEKD